MGTSSKSNQLGATSKVGDRLLAFFMRSYLHREDYSIVVLIASTFIMIAMTLIAIRCLKRYGHENRSKLTKQSTKPMNLTNFNDQIEDLSIQTEYDFNKPPPLSFKSRMILDKLVRQLHYSADKCYINRYADRCIQLINYYPQLINMKFGSTGLTPFHRVCFHGQAMLMKMMLKMGANPHLTTDTGENSICLALYYYLHKPNDEQVRNMICLHILHRAGCRIEANSVWYNVFLRMAVRTRKKGLVEWLLMNNQNPKYIQIKRSISNPLSF